MFEAGWEVKTAGEKRSSSEGKRKGRGLISNRDIKGAVKKLLKYKLKYVICKAFPAYIRIAITIGAARYTQLYIGLTLTESHPRHRILSFCDCARFCCGFFGDVYFK
jgi:hypothetical protein